MTGKNLNLTKNFFLSFTIMFLQLAVHADSFSIREKNFEIEFDKNYCPISINFSWQKLKQPCHAAEIIYNGSRFLLQSPTSSEITKNALFLKYQIRGLNLEVALNYEFEKISAQTVLKREFAVKHLGGEKQQLSSDLTIRAAQLIDIENNFWVPHKNGVGSTVDIKKYSAIYRAAGIHSKSNYDMAIPVAMFKDRNKNNHGVFLDPYFSAKFYDQSLEWTYSQKVGLERDTEKRQIYNVLLPNSTDKRELFDDVMKSFYQTALSDVPPGPEWLKDIAMVSYDYMSDDGQGWYRDLRILAQNIPREKRHKVMVTLHGWYDFVGRFSLTLGSKKLDNEWKSFRPGVGQLSVSKIRERLKFAKDLGFKVALYYAGGVQSSSNVEISKSPEHILGRGYWQGPDMKGVAVFLNPAAKKVYDFFIDLINAQIDAFGDLVDAYVCDETFFISAGNLGTTQVPGYVDRTYMHLIKDITKQIHNKCPQAAFLTSDAIHPHQLNEQVNLINVPPYALFGDGTYQDTDVRPDSWSYGIFPNYRNTLFGCNWHDISKFTEMKFGVQNYQAPVVFTNGWGDNIGLSEMNVYDRRKFFELFEERSKYKTKLKWFETLPQFKR